MRRPRRPHESGFTLLEALVVLAIISVLITVTTPSMRAFTEGRRLRVAGEALRSLCLFARDIATTEGEDYLLVVDFESQRYWLAKGAALDANDLSESIGIGAYGLAESSSATDASAPTATTENDGIVLDPRVRGIVGQPRALGEGIRLVRLDVEREGSVNSVASNLDYVEFFADGTAEPASIYLMSTSGQGLVVDVPLGAAQTRSRLLAAEELEVLLR